MDGSIQNAPKADSLIAPYKSSLDKTMNEVIGSSAIEMKRIKTDRETLLGNFVADLTFDYAYNLSLLDTFTFGTPDMCILNFGGLRTSVPKGDITRGLVFELMPFENDVVVIKMNKQDMTSMMRYLSASPQPISRAGLFVSATDTTFTINGEKLEDRTYTVVTSDYLAGGGDNMRFFKGKEIYRLQKLRTVIMQHIESSPEPVNAKLNNRIKHGE